MTPRVSNDNDDDRESLINLLGKKTTPAQKEARKRFLARITDEKPSPQEAHDLVRYINALETTIGYYVTQARLVPRRQIQDVNKYNSEDAERAYFKLVGIAAARPKEAEDESSG
ncbi:MAG: hypothetical protein HY247_06160 [archaeon]|nr:MAG: hypothetical protein HY247_06160 [archaeon]